MSIREHISEIGLIADSELASQVDSAWTAALAFAGTELTSTRLLVPDASPEVGLEHQRCTVRLALAISDVLGTYHRTEINRDHVAAGALLHDLGKVVVAAGRDGNAIARHPFYGAHFALQAGVPREVVHIVAAHSIEGSYVSKTLECHIVAAADMLSADALLRELGRTIFDHKRALYLP